MTHSSCIVYTMAADDLGTQRAVQGISSYGIELVLLECSRLISRRVNTLRQRQDGCHFPDGMINCIFLNEKFWILIKISLKFVPKGPISNIPSLVQIMAWRRSGDKPLSESMMVSLLTHICITRPQWVQRQRHTQKAKTIRSSSIRHRSDTKVSDRCLIHVNLRVFVI